MKRLMVIGFLCALVLSLTGVAPVSASSSSQTYTVLVGSENSRAGISIMSYFPKKLTIHVGDSVVWTANSHEIHTVTFLAGAAMPDLVVPSPSGAPSPIMINPQAGFPAGPQNGQYDGSTYVNSGLISTDPGQVANFTLTFTKTGTYQYVCVVHGMMMSAEVDVVDSSVSVPSPKEVNREAHKEMAQAWSQVPGVMAQAKKQVQPPVHNADGTTTWKVMVGYSSGVVDIMRFFPKNLRVKPGDTVEWDLSSADVAPHTITFLNGHPDPALVTPFPQPGGPPALLLNPVIFFPSKNAAQGAPLNHTDYFNSGLLNPAPQGPTSFSLKIGDSTGVFNYACLLHDASGMIGRLFVR